MTNVILSVLLRRYQRLSHCTSPFALLENTKLDLIRVYSVRPPGPYYLWLP
jgi:hypothetical protein